MTDAANKRIRPIEVVVIIAIILVLGSLLLPATVSVGRSATEVMCESNLRVLGIAMLSYHESHGAFPPGIVAAASLHRLDRYGQVRPFADYVARSEKCDNPGNAKASALTLILPFVGEKATHDAYNMSLACCAVQNATSVATRVHAFACPSSDPIRTAGRGYYLAPQGITAAGPATADYALSAGGVGLITQDFGRRTYCALMHSMTVPGVNKRAMGIFGLNSFATLDADFKDGASHTFLMGEAYSGGRVVLRSNGRLARGNEPMDGEWSSLAAQTPWSQGYLGSEPDDQGGRVNGNFGGYGSVFAATAWNAYYGKGPELTQPDQWFAIVPNEGGIGAARATFYRRSVPDVNFIVGDSSAIPGEIGSLQGFRSRHSTVPMLFGDGSVRQIKPTIDPWLWVALSTPEGREKLPNGY